MIQIHVPQVRARRAAVHSHSMISQIATA